MKVKKFTASNNHEALNLVRSELGSNAIILYQRRVRPKGFFGFLKKPIIEVVAAREEDVSHKNKLGVREEKRSENPVQLLQERVRNSQSKEFPPSKINEEVDEIKGMLNTVLEKINHQQLPDFVRASNNEKMKKLFLLLKKQGLEESLIEEILRKCVGSESENSIASLDKEWIHGKIKKVINNHIKLKNDDYSAKVLFFIGPTGVGKTTTIAKLAAQYTLEEGKSVGLISADTYRIAAVQQLKVYSDILNLPLEVIYNPSEIQDAVSRLNNKDTIMVDTAGRSHRDKKQMHELRALLEEIDEKEIYLVLSCTSKDNDIREIIKTYSFLTNYNIIFTKIDEATNLGTILNTAKNTQQPITYITTGQSVPDDIELLNHDKIVNLLMREVPQ